MNLRNLLKEINDNGGVSYNITTGDYNPTDGYMVSLPGYETTLFPDDLSEQVIKDYIFKNIEFLANGSDYYLGAWIENNRVYLDISVKINDLYEACYSGIVNEQLAIFDNANAVAIHLPTPQKSGTFTQQATYNKQAADRVTKGYLERLSIIE
jgi:DNA mismatch repair ATPase MutS